MLNNSGDKLSPWSTPLLTFIGFVTNEFVANNNNKAKCANSH